MEVDELKEQPPAIAGGGSVGCNANDLPRMGRISSISASAFQCLASESRHGHTTRIVSCSTPCRSNTVPGHPQ